MKRNRNIAQRGSASPSPTMRFFRNILEPSSGGTGNMLKEPSPTLSANPNWAMGHISASYRDKLMSHLVDDETCRRGNETGDHNLEVTRSSKETSKIAIGNCY